MQDATPSVVEQKSTSDLMFDTMFANLMDDLMDEVLAEDAASPTTPIISQLETASKPVSELGLDAAVDAAVAATLRGLPKQLIEETIDKMTPAEMKGGRVAQMQASVEHSYIESKSKWCNIFRQPSRLFGPTILGYLGLRF